LHAKIKKFAKCCNLKFVETAQNTELHIFEYLGSCTKKLQKLALIITQYKNM